jgi:hypothetical protein
MRGKIDKIALAFLVKVLGALYVEAELIKTRSQKEFVPVDLGPLRSSGHVQPPRRKGREIEVTIAFGGVSAPYALAIHEHPSQYSPPSWRGKSEGEINWSPKGRGPKYLEKPLNEALKDMDARLARRLAL